MKENGLLSKIVTRHVLHRSVL